jgi:hypothetical protein
MKIPRGVVEDVLIKVDKFYFPLDFIVLDTQPVKNSDIQIPIILGHHFLATTNALINCRTGVIKISFGNVCMIDNLVHETFIQSSIEDPLEACLA